MKEVYETPSEDATFQRLLYDRLATSDARTRAECIVKCLKTAKVEDRYTSPLGLDDRTAFVKASYAIHSLIVEHSDGANRALTKALRNLQTSFISHACKIYECEAEWAVETYMLHFLRDLYDSQGKCISKSVFLVIEALLHEEIGRPALRPEALISLYSSLGKGADVPSLFADILTQLKHKTIAASASKAFSTLVGKLQACSMALYDEWVEPLELIIKDSAELADLYLFPLLFKCIGQHCYYLLLERWDVQYKGRITRLSEKRDLQQQLYCLKAGKQLGYLVEESDTLNGDIWVLDTQAMESLIASEPELMLNALSVLVTSSASTTRIPATAFPMLKEFIKNLHEICDSNLRNQFMKALKDLFQRMLSSTYSVERTNAKLKTYVDETSNTRNGATCSVALDIYIQTNIDFMRWYVDFLIQLLQPGSPHSSCVTSLNVLTLLLSSGLDREAFDPERNVNACRRIVPDLFNGNVVPWPFQISLVTETTRELLIEQMFNPYEDIRRKVYQYMQTAGLYNSNPPDHVGRIASGRESDVDGFAKLCMLSCSSSPSFSVNSTMKDCQTSVNLDNNAAFQGFSWLVKLLRHYLERMSEHQTDIKYRNSIIGIISALAGLMLEGERNFDGWEVSIKEVYGLCENVWKDAQESLRDGAPEGFFPAIDEDVEFESSQELQSYCWRSVKESARLIEGIATAISTSEEMNAGATVDACAAILFDGLSQIRHRGAFTAIASRFSAVCTICLRSKEPHIQRLPAHYLDLSLRQMREKSGVITRRSAGLPLIFTGILNAEALAKRPSSIEKLFEHLSTVHAINCLRSIFMDSKLNALSSIYIVKALQLALNCFLSSVYPVRNSGIMLFNVLVNRIFGTHSNGGASLLSTSTFFAKYPNLENTLLHVLRESNLDEVTLPVFSLFARLRYSYDDHAMLPFQPFIISATTADNWKIREAASRALTAVVAPGHLELILHEMLKGERTVSENPLHARMYAAQLFLRRDLQQTVREHGLESLKNLRDQIWERMEEFTSESFSHIIATEYIRLVTQFLFPEFEMGEVWDLLSSDERDCYCRLMATERQQIAGFTISTLEHYPDLWDGAHAARYLKQLLSTLVYAYHSGIVPSQVKARVLAELLERAVYAGHEMTIRCILERVNESDRVQDWGSQSGAHFAQILHKIVITSSDLQTKILTANVLCESPSMAAPQDWADYLAQFEGTDSSCFKGKLLIVLASISSAGKPESANAVSKLLDIIEERCTTNESESVRLSALRALSKVSETLAKLQSNKELECRFYMLLLTRFLMDDSEEIRQVAIAVFKEYSQERCPKTSRSSSLCVAKILKRQEDPSAIEWIVNYIIDTHLTAFDMKELLQAQEESSRTLFLHEKQNTFIDEVFLMDILMDILTNFCPLIAGRTMDHIRRFQLAGWRTLDDNLMARPDCRQCFSDPAIYLAGMKMIEGGRLWLQWMGMHGVDSTETGLARKLGDIVGDRHRGKLHPLWTKRLEALRHHL